MRAQIIGVLAAVVTALPIQGSLAAPVGRSVFRLFQEPGAAARGNRVGCWVNSIGHLCVHSHGSGSAGGGFWPAGSSNEFIFDGGLLVAGIVDAPAGDFALHGDTVGAFFYDPRGDQEHGASLSRVFDPASWTGRARWPAAATLRDAGLFHPVLLGRPFASDHDLWVRYWDGGPNRFGRAHPTGLLVEQRVMGWRGPLGLEDVLFVHYRLVNVTARTTAAYAALAAGGTDAATIAEYARLGARFQDAVEAETGLVIPDAGYDLRDVYVATAQDPDIGSPTHNYSSASLPFGLAAAWRADFREPSWSAPPELYAPPFAAGSGFVASALLRAPTEAPQESILTAFTNYTGGGAHPDSRGVVQLWRRLSLNMTAADGNCSEPSPRTRRFCFIGQAQADTRYGAAMGRFNLPAGGDASLVIALVFAPALDSVVARLGTNVQPGLPTEGGRLAAGLDTVKSWERAAGWQSHADSDGDGVIEPSEVTVAPRSLLWKVQVAHAFANGGFLAPQAPEPPRFALVPDDGRVTIVWERSTTETTGDPYFPIAADPTTPLYDPSYREFDVEGYRIWRGTSPDAMQLLAQFDHWGTVITDVRGLINVPEQCAPELGLILACPQWPRSVELAHAVVQLRPGDRIPLGGTAATLRADTMVTGGGSRLPPLANTGIPYVFVDSTVRNGVSYHYAVTAFDANSYWSGPSSLESPRRPRPVRPRSASQVGAVLAAGLIGDDGQFLPLVTFPPLDNETGVLRGAIPPATAMSVSLPAVGAPLLLEGEVRVRTDSVSPGSALGFGPHPMLYLTLSTQAGDSVAVTVGLNQPTFNAAASTAQRSSISHRLLVIDSSAVLRGSGTAVPVVRAPLGVSWRAAGLATASPSVSLSRGRFGAQGTTPAARYLLHSRWFDAGAAEPPDATLNPFGSAANTAGQLGGVSLIFAPQAYRLPLTGPRAISPEFRGVAAAAGAAWYPADFDVTWQTGGGITVRDLTHRVDLPFKKSLQPGWGFLNQRAIAAAGVANTDLADGIGAPTVGVLSYHHAYAVRPVCSDWWLIGCADLEPTAQLQPVDYTGDGIADGQGLGIVVNGEIFFMLMNALPAPGTRWRLRALGGGTLDATCTPALPTTGDLLPAATPTDCSGYSFTETGPRGATVPGLTWVLRVTRSADTAIAATSLDAVHTVPDPYYYRSSSLETDGQLLRFVGLPPQALVRIYSTGGTLVNILSHNDPSGGGELRWNLRTRSGARVATGIYFFHIETADGRTRIGRFTIVNQR